MAGAAGYEVDCDPHRYSTIRSSPAWGPAGHPCGSSGTPRARRPIASRAGRGLWVAVLSQAELLDLFVANEAIEPYLARIAAARATATHIEAMSRAVRDNEWDAEQGDLTSFLAHGRHFHRAIGEATGNPILTRFVVQNEERADMYLVSNVEPFEFDAWWPSVHEHEAILKTIVRREPEEAARLITYHSQSVRHRLQRVFTGGKQGGVNS